MNMIDFPQWQNEQKYSLGHLQAGPETSELSVEPGKTPLQKADVFLNGLHLSP